MSDLNAIDITPQQAQERDALFKNEALKKYMSAGIANTGTTTPVAEKLKRQQKAIDVLSTKGESFWSFDNGQ